MLPDAETDGRLVPDTVLSAETLEAGLLDTEDVPETLDAEFLDAGVVLTAELLPGVTRPDLVDEPDDDTAALVVVLLVSELLLLPPPPLRVVVLLVILSDPVAYLAP